MDTLIIATLNAVLVLLAAGAILFLASLAVLASASQMTIKRWWRTWHKNRLNLRKDRAYQQFRARYRKE